MDTKKSGHPMLSDITVILVIFCGKYCFPPACVNGRIKNLLAQTTIASLFPSYLSPKETPVIYCTQALIAAVDIL